MAIPLTRPAPPRLSQANAQLEAIEERGHFSNFGPVNSAFEQAMLQRMFGGAGACMTVCNATLGLMIAVQQAIGRRPLHTRYALMPSFTFAAAAQAAMWCGLVPLFCDIDPDDWTASAAEEDRLLAAYGADIAVVMPYATFGYDIDLERYQMLTERTGVPVVVDAASSLGTVSGDGRGFGAGFAGTIVFSMHATKSFATGEGGLIYSAQPERVAQLRQMANFGFGRPRTATMPGLNAKLSEVGALLGQLRLEDYGAIMAHRAALVEHYRRNLPDLVFQARQPGRQAHQFASVLLPAKLAARRGEITALLAGRGIGAAAYFSPHLMQQDYFLENAVAAPLPVTNAVAARIISLPLFDMMTLTDVDTVCTELRAAIVDCWPQRARALVKRPETLVSQVGAPAPADVEGLVA